MRIEAVAFGGFLARMRTPLTAIAVDCERYDPCVMEGEVDGELDQSATDLERLFVGYRMLDNRDLA